MFGMRRSYNRKSYNGFFGIIGLIFMGIAFLFAVPYIVYLIGLAVLFVFKKIAEYFSNNAVNVAHNVYEETENENIITGAEYVENLRSSVPQAKNNMPTEEEKYYANITNYMNKLRTKYPYADANLFSDYEDEICTAPPALLNKYEEMFKESNDKNKVIKRMEATPNKYYTMKEVNDGELVKTINRYPAAMNVYKMEDAYVLVIKDLEVGEVELYQAKLNEYKKIQMKIDEIVTFLDEEEKENKTIVMPAKEL